MPTRPAAIAAVMVVVALIVRAPTFGNPVLHIDEQFYLLVGDRLLHGAIPYVDIWDRKPIGIFLIYAAARLLGGDGIVQYQLVAAAAAAATAFLVVRLSEQVASRPAALSAGIGYLLWLNLDGGDGGQSPVFYNLPMAAAALLVVRTFDSGGNSAAKVRRRGAAAMLLAGLAIQIKYTAVFEGAAFGLALLWASFRAGGRVPALLANAVLWIGIALLPTAAAALAYLALGHFDAFVFANFVSILARGASPPAAVAIRLATLILILSPLLLGALCSGLWSAGPRDRLAGRLVIAWLVVACAAVLVFGTYFRSYGLPVMLPASVAAARCFDRGAIHRRLFLGFLGLALVAGQITLVISSRNTGGRPVAMAMLRAMQGHPGCPFVFDGHPFLYMRYRACPPTRFAFPGHLNQANEAGALGVDALAETRRILDTRPGVIAIMSPAWSQANPATRRLVEARLARDYRLIYAVRTRKRVPMIHALRSDAPHVRQTRW